MGKGKSSHRSRRYQRYFKSSKKYFKSGGLFLYRYSTGKNRISLLSKLKKFLQEINDRSVTDISEVARNISLEVAFSKGNTYYK
ncbi:hypothetical protein Avbf_12163 [Armadillidium vulgare]|nr:hypothetical protein Avbf_12163 [Armadillidium vulgare]